MKANYFYSTANVFIKGQIGSFGMFPGFELIDLITQVEKLKDAPELIVQIDSPGGFSDVGFAMYDYLVSQKKPISVIATGQCCSIATIIAIAGDKGKRSIVKGTDYLIHNPFLQDVTGDADELQRAADFAREEEDRIIAFYHKHLGISKSGLDAIMKENKFMPLEKAVELGFFDSIIDGVLPVNKLKPIAISNLILNYKKTDPMDAKELKDIKDEQSSILKLLNAILKGIGIKGNIKNLAVKTTEGVELTIEAAGDTYAIGDPVMVAGAPAVSATYILEDGNTIVTDAAGLIAEIILPQAAMTDAEITAALADIRAHDADRRAMRFFLMERSLRGKDRGVAPMKPEVRR